MPGAAGIYLNKGHKSQQAKINLCVDIHLGGGQRRPSKSTRNQIFSPGDHKISIYIKKKRNGPHFKFITRKHSRPNSLRRWCRHLLHRRLELFVALAMSLAFGLFLKGLTNWKIYLHRKFYWCL